MFFVQCQMLVFHILGFRLLSLENFSISKSWIITHIDLVHGTEKWEDIWCDMLNPSMSFSSIINLSSFLTCNLKCSLIVIQWRKDENVYLFLFNMYVSWAFPYWMLFTPLHSLYNPLTLLACALRTSSWWDETWRWSMRILNAFGKRT
jgi:hypothetical protein